MLERSLARFQSLEQDSAFSAFLGKDSECDKRQNESMLPIQKSKSAFHVTEYLREITSKIHHWNRPRYFDRALVQRPMSGFRPTNSFIVCLDKQ